MPTFVLLLAAAVAIGASGCGATTRTTTIQTPAAFPTLISATATFVSKDHGKDADSALTVQLLRNNAELGAEIRSVGTKFDDSSSSAPFAFSVVGPFTKNDIDDGQLRLRLTPDGDDDWTFDLHVTMRFSDGTARNFTWRGVRLDHRSPERVLTLDPART